MTKTIGNNKTEVVRAIIDIFLPLGSVFVGTERILSMPQNTPAPIMLKADNKNSTEPRVVPPKKKSV